MSKPGKKARAEQATRVTDLELTTLKLDAAEVANLKLQLEARVAAANRNIDAVLAKYNKPYGINTATGDIVRMKPEPPKAV